MKKFALLGVIGLLLLGGWLWQRPKSTQSAENKTSVVEALSGEADENFARALIPNDIQFPRDYGSHDEYQTEWWYYTGNLASEDGREFGFQFTIFRRALTATPIKTESTWRTNQMYFVHFALSDIANEQFYAQEKFGRGGAGMAGATAEPYHVWVDDWQVIEQEDGRIKLSADTGTYALDLDLTQTLAPILHGDGGLSAKSFDVGNASHYYSQVRQEAVGTVTVGDESVPVTGKVWKDHEYSTSVLADGALGWDWISLQFDDGSSLMLFHIRKEGGELEPASSGTFIDANGNTTALLYTDWELRVTEEWTSPVTNATYPVAWQIDIPSLELNLIGNAKMKNQELNLSSGAYWEGAVEFSGDGVQANGYIELTGY